MHLARNNWEPFVYQRLTELIEQFQQPAQTSVDKRAYVVFDFDNTSAIGDVEDNLMMYFLEHLAYRLEPETLLKIMTTGPFDFDTAIDSNHPRLTLRNLARDVNTQYTWLYKHYIQEANLTLSEIKQSEQYHDFAAKIRFYYKWVNSNLQRIAGEPWLTYWFSGHTPEELISITRTMLKEALAKPNEVKHMKSSSKFPGEAGVVETNFISGLSFPEELVDLYAAFQRANIETYVVSASPIDVVRTAATEFGYHVPYDQVIGMRYTLNEEGEIEAQMAPDTFITKQAGKSEAITALIATRHQNRQPIALFGDSMGDYHMMRHFNDVKLNVLFNCYHQDDTQKLVTEAVEVFNQANARFVLQGRDENKGSLHPSRATIPLGKTKEILYVDTL